MGHLLLLRRQRTANKVFLSADSVKSPWGGGLPTIVGVHSSRRMDEDLDGLTLEQLVAEVRRLRAGIRQHRDSSGHELCWHHPALWGLLPERTDPLPVVPAWPQFLRGCVRYRESLDEQLPGAPRSADEAE